MAKRGCATQTELIHDTQIYKQKWNNEMANNNENEHNRYPHERRLIPLIIPPLRRGLRRRGVAAPNGSLLHNQSVKRGKRMHAHEYKIFTHNMADLRSRLLLDGQPSHLILLPPPPPLRRPAEVRPFRNHLRQRPDYQYVDS